MIEVIADAVKAATTQAAEPPAIVKIITNWAFPIGIMLVAMMFLSKNKGKKSDQERQELLKALKKGDRVQTIGGLIATVVSADDNEVLLKVDETTNTKMRFSRTAIHRVIEPS
jgi:preprotein translocase subunit YajC